MDSAGKLKYSFDCGITNNAFLFHFYILYYSTSWLRYSGNITSAHAKFLRVTVFTHGRVSLVVGSPGLKLYKYMYINSILCTKNKIVSNLKTTKLIYHANFI